MPHLSGLRPAVFLSLSPSFFMYACMQVSEDNLGCLPVAYLSLSGPDLAMSARLASH